MAEGGTSSYYRKRKSCIQESLFEQRFRRLLGADNISQGSNGGVGKREGFQENQEYKIYSTWLLIRKQEHDRSVGRIPDF